MSLNKSKSLRTAEKYVLQGKIPAAIDEYRKIVEADPGDLTTINTLGDLYVRAGRIQDAIKNFSRIAESYREGGFTLKAIAMLKKISKLDPTNVDTAMKLANLYSQQGLLVEARQQYLQVADAFARSGQAQKALEAYQKIADLDPSNTSVRMKLGEIYLREGLKDQAHEAFVTAGAELLRKNELEQALTANLKAVAINPDSRHALTALATIYTQHGQADKAINLLCDAFERSPGDTELLTILGRTYLAADWLDDAERTFLSLVELDRTRYHYLLEVGRRFLQLENLDRAAELIDGCIDILIAKREEDKALEFLRRILDHDSNHIPALKRLAQIYLRIREDHNLIGALHSVVEAALQKGEEPEAVAALKELIRLEPGEASHLQRLHSLGITDPSDVGTGSSVYAANPFGSASDEAYIIRQISEAEILAGLGQVDQAVENLTTALEQSPDSIQIHLKLKDIYLRNGRMKDAAARCLELSQIHKARGETARASDYVAEAKHLYPDIHELQGVQPAGAGYASAANSFALGMNFSEDKKASPVDLGYPDESNFQIQESADAFSFRESDPFHLAGHNQPAGEDDFGFEMFAASENGSIFNGRGSAEAGEPADEAAIRYFDEAHSDTSSQHEHEAADMVFRATGNLPTDTMPQILRDELEGIDFYIAQGYTEIAKDTLDRLREAYGDHPGILARYESLGIAPAAAKQPVNGQAPNVGDSAFRVNDSGEIDLDLNEAFHEPSQSVSENTDFRRENNFAFSEPEPHTNGHQGIADFQLETPRGPQKDEDQSVEPFLVHKDSGMLDEQDLILKFNTRELAKDAAYDFVAQSAVNPAAPEASGALHQDVAPANGNAEIPAEPISDFDFANSTKDAEQDLPAQSESSSLFASESSPLSLPDWEFNEEGDARSVQTAQSEETGQELLDLTPEEPLLLQSEKEPLPVDAQPSQAEPATFQEMIGLGDLLDEEDGEESELQRLLEDLKEDSDGIANHQDYETHYSLGLAYKDMELLDDAIEQFQLAFKFAAKGSMTQHHIECCHMLGFCFRRKYLPKVAVMWLQRGLTCPDSSEDEYQALRYEIGSCYEEMGDTDKALDAFIEVYGIDVNYRDVSKRIDYLQAIKNT